MLFLSNEAQHNYGVLSKAFWKTPVDVFKRRGSSHSKGFDMKDSTDQVPQFMKYFFVAFIVCASASMLIVYWLGHA
jgi:hypothetical protein